MSKFGILAEDINEEDDVDLLPPSTEQALLQIKPPNASNNPKFFNFI